MLNGANLCARAQAIDRQISRDRHKKAAQTDARLNESNCLALDLVFERRAFFEWTRCDAGRCRA